MKFVLGCAIALMLAGCVRTSVSMLDENTAIISAKGTAFDSAATVQHDTLVRAAQLTVNRGLRYFSIVGSQDTTRHGTLYVPGQTYSNGTYSGTANTYGNATNYNGSYTGNTYTTPGSAIALIKPGMDITIRMYADGRASTSTPGVWDARSILAVNPR